MAMMDYQPLEIRDEDMPVQTMVFARAPAVGAGQTFTTDRGVNMWQCRQMEKITHCVANTCEKPGYYRVRVSRI